MICRDVYRCHPDDLTPEQHVQVLDFLALAIVEQETT